MYNDCQGEFSKLMEEKMDLRIKKTKKSIIDAFLQLLKEKNFNQISISDITRKAMIARPTFYLHYRNKREVLVEYLDILFAQYLEEIRPVLRQEDQYQLPAALFRQVRKNAPYLYSLLHENAVVIIQDKLHQYIRDVFGLMLREQFGEQAPDISQNVRDYIVAAVAGMVWAVILKWMDEGMQEQPEKMGKMLNTISRPGILNLLNTGM